VVPFIVLHYPTREDQYQSHCVAFVSTIVGYLLLKIVFFFFSGPMSSREAKSKNHSCGSRGLVHLSSPYYLK